MIKPGQMKLYSLAFYISIALAIVGLLVAPKGTFVSFFKLPNKAALNSSLGKLYLSLVLAWFGGLITQGAIYELFQSDFENTMASSLRSGTFHWFFVFVILGVLVPVIEEIFFRGYVFEAFNRIQNHIFFSTVSMALLFGLCHPHFFASILFAIFALELKLRTGSLLLPIGAHVFLNSVALLIILTTPSYLSNLEPLDFQASLVSLAIGLVLLVVSYTLLPKNLCALTNKKLRGSL